MEQQVNDVTKCYTIFKLYSTGKNVLAFLKRISFFSFVRLEDSISKIIHIND